MGKAGYDTTNSTHYFSIPGSFSSTATGPNSTLCLNSNVNVPGRWAFRIDSEPLNRAVLPPEEEIFWIDINDSRFTCQSIQKGTCIISGDPHYIMFDGELHHFQGPCTYVLSEQCGATEGLPNYRVEGSNEHRGSAATWTKLVKVFVYTETIELVRGHRGEAKVNGEFKTTPFFLSNGDVHVYTSGFSIVVTTIFGLEVSYDANHHVVIKVPYSYHGATCGLCGNFNSNGTDDFQTPQGEIVSVVEFGNSWRVVKDDEPDCESICEGPECGDCPEDMKVLYASTEHCGILQDRSGPFAACHQVLSPEPFVHNCVFDLCLEREEHILCQALEVYARHCQENGVQVASWRRPGFCEIHCPANSHYESQSTACPATCVDLESPHDCALAPVESCICNEGYVLSGADCVPLHECGCMIGGHYYHSGQTVTLNQDCSKVCACISGNITCTSHSCEAHEQCKVVDGERGCYSHTCSISGMSIQPGVSFWADSTCTQKCTCTNSGLSCHNESCAFSQVCESINDFHFTCQSIQKGTCIISGDPHYIMFDGELHHFQGPCTYVLSEQCGATEGLPNYRVEGSNEHRGSAATWTRLVKVFVYTETIELVKGHRGEAKVNGEFKTTPFFLSNGDVHVYTSEIHCPANSHYESQSTACPASCVDLESPHDCALSPVESCICNEGYVLSGADCVPLHECGCMIDGHYYHSGQTVTLNQDCSKVCACISGNITCTSHSCEAHEQCKVVDGERGCYSHTCSISGMSIQPGVSFWADSTCTQKCTCTNSGLSCHNESCAFSQVCESINEFHFTCQSIQKGTCIISGDPHYIMFDGELHHFQGPCTYVLSEQCGATEGLPNYRVEGSNEHRGSAATWTRLVKVFVYTETIELVKGHRGEAKVNEIHCPVNSHYESQSTACPATCVDLESPHDCALAPVESCICNEGYVLSGADCVPLHECGCMIDGHYYHSGQTVTLNQDCSKVCACISGNITCTSHSCEAHEQCKVVDGERGCYSHTCSISGMPSSQVCPFGTDSTCTQKCTCTNSGLSCHNESCASSQVCESINDFHFTCQSIQKGTCIISGDPHYIMFDGELHHFQGPCTYVLSEQCGATEGLPNYRVEGSNEHRGSAATWTRLVKVFVYTETIELVKGHRGEAKVNGEFKTTPFFLSNGDVHVYTSGFSIVVTTIFGLEVSYDANHHVVIKVPYSYHGATCGLCGNFNSNRTDDFQTPQGEIVSVVEFGNSWRVVKDDEPDCESVCEGSECGDCPEDMKVLYASTEHCGILQDSSGPFAACHQVLSPEPFVHNCVFDLCLEREEHILCQALAVYAHHCQENGVQVASWRNPASVKSTVQSTATTSLRVQHVQLPVWISSLPMTVHSLPCEAHEQCKVVDGERGCYSHTCSISGMSIQPGVSFWTDSTCTQKCTCTNSGLSCHNESCASSQVCESINDFHFTCQSIQKGTCIISGDPHYIMFDGELHHFQGPCTYVLSEQCGATEGLPNYRVEGSNEHRGSAATWTRLVKVFVYTETIELVKGHRGEAKVNGEYKTTPFFLSNGDVHVYTSGFSIVVTTIFGLEVSYDANHHVVIKVPYSYHGATCGLCGNFNSNRTDDFQTPQGEIVSVVEFGNSWRVVKDDEPDCESREEHILCQALAVYAHHCQENGVQVASWRKPGFCEIHCQSTATTSLRVQHVQLPVWISSLPMTVHSLPCEAHEQCKVVDGERGCYSHTCSISGMSIQPGVSFWTDSTCTQKCTCTNSGLSCHNESCASSQVCESINDFHFTCQSIQKGTCIISGDPHYIMFDGELHHFQGPCTYVLSEQCGATEGLPNYRVEGSNEHRGSAATWTRLVKVFVYTETIELVKGHRGEAKVNGEYKTTPFFLSNGDVHVYTSGFSIVVTTIFGLEVSYDANHHVVIKVPYSYHGATCGLCGNFNSNRTDDFQTPQGEIVSVVEFGNSWRVVKDDEPDCESVCEGSDCGDCPEDMKVLYASTEHCGILQDSSGPFAACHQVLSPEPFVHNCVFDLCLEREEHILCQALAVYAHHCQENGVQVASWRKPGFCEIHCPANSHYESQGTACPATCVDLEQYGQVKVNGI
ncbi:hypothetical protein WMY93_010900 [Mugilogobius chulae]|uniref:Uncharacterized protein n=1 Tax=Mugilogobius chulae TaxID=88201 RepID=A0AAW0PK85_9GOBI